MESVFLVLLVLSLSVVWPQPGYIHPDEFFQSTEVIAGKSVSVCLSLSPPPPLSRLFYKAMSSMTPNFLDGKLCSIERGTQVGKRGGGIHRKQNRIKIKPQGEHETWG